MCCCRSDNSTSAQDDTAEDSVAVLVSAHHRQSEAGYADESQDEEGGALSIAGGQNMHLPNKRERMTNGSAPNAALRCRWRSRQHPRQRTLVTCRRQQILCMPSSWVRACIPRSTVDPRQFQLDYTECGRKTNSCSGYLCCGRL